MTGTARRRTLAIVLLLAVASATAPLAGASDSTPAATDPEKAGLAVAGVGGERIRATWVVPHVQCPDEGKYGIAYRLAAFGEGRDFAGGATIQLVCRDGERTTEMLLWGAEGRKEPDIHFGPADPLRFTIVDLGSVTEVRVHNLENGHHDSYGYGRESVIEAEVGASRINIDFENAPIPPFDGFAGFTNLRFGASDPRTWTRIDMVDEAGEVELRTVRDGRRSFDLVLADR